MLEAIINQLSNISPGLGDDLVSENSPELFQELESAIGTPLPPEFVALYSKFNGTNSTKLMNFVYGYAFNNLQTILQRAKEDMANVETYPLDYAEPAIEPAYVFSQYRLQLGDDSGTSLLCMDLSPTESGNNGQVIMLDYDAGKSFVVASSVTQLLNDFHADLERGLYQLDKDALDNGDYWLEPASEIDLINWSSGPSRWSYVPK